MLLGTVTRPHGIRGELKVRPYTEKPENLARYPRLYLSADGGKTKAAYTNVYARAHGNAVILRLKECTDRDQAEKLAGMQIWLASTDLPPVGKDEFYLYTLEGKLAKTKDGLLLGMVTSLLTGSCQDVLVIRSADEEYLVPLVREFIVTVADKEVVLDVPPGLLEINR